MIQSHYSRFIRRVSFVWTNDSAEWDSMDTNQGWQFNPQIHIFIGYLIRRSRIWIHLLTCGQTRIRPEVGWVRIRILPPTHGVLLGIRNRPIVYFLVLSILHNKEQTLTPWTPCLTLPITHRWPPLIALLASCALSRAPPKSHRPQHSWWRMTGNCPFQAPVPLAVAHISIIIILFSFKLCMMVD